MVQCSRCQSALFVDFAGNVIVGGGEDQSTPPDDIELGQQEYSEVAEPWANSPDGSHEEQSPEEIQVEGAPAVASDFIDSPFIGNAVEPMTGADGEPRFETENDASTDLPFEENQLVLAERTADSREFSRSESMPPVGGIVFFRLRIEGIDSASLRREILGVLMDSRLGLVNDEISGTIHDGRLEIQGLNAPKVSIIMNALKHLPIEVNWQMYAEDASNQTN